MTQALPLPTAAEPKPRRPIRIVTAASLFDGHDAAINVMRRIIQASGAEVIHLGHNRSAAEIVECAIQEDATAIAVTSYQGGHIEFFKYMHDLLAERGADILIFGGGGGTILPSEVEELHRYGITRIYTPDDGRAMGLQGMIDDLLRHCDRARPAIDLDAAWVAVPQRDPKTLGRLISLAENEPERVADLREGLAARLASAKAPVLGVTGTGGAGKSSLVDEFVRRFLAALPTSTIAIISVDPSRRRTGGALLGDRIRMNAVHDPRVYMRSLATRQSNLALSKHVRESIDICRAAGFDLVIVETSGIGQSDTEITEHADVSLYVMTAEYGAATQLEKIDMLDFADLVAINKFDKAGSLDAIRDVRKQYKRNRQLWDAGDDTLPIFGTIAAQFNDAGMNRLFTATLDAIAKKTGVPFMAQRPLVSGAGETARIIPAERGRYLAEIVEGAEDYARFVQEQSAIARRMYQLNGALEQLRSREGQAALVVQEPAEGGVVRVEQTAAKAPEWIAGLQAEQAALEAKLAPECKRLLAEWPTMVARYRADRYEFKVRDKVISQDLFTESLSGTRVPKVSLPRYSDWGDILTWLLTEAPPGMFPFAAGVFPLKRQGEEPARMFAGEGGPERTNRRFHYVSNRHAGQAALYRLRLGHALRRESRAPSRHLRQDRQCRRQRGDGGRRQEALLRLRPLRSRHVRLHDDQRARADGAGLLPERRGGPAVRALDPRAGPGRRGDEAHRGDVRPARPRAASSIAAASPTATTGSASCCSARAATTSCPSMSMSASAPPRSAACAARSRPTSSRRTRPRTPASSPRSLPCG